jgi:hypothetical protein
MARARHSIAGRRAGSSLRFDRLFIIRSKQNSARRIDACLGANKLRLEPITIRREYSKGRGSRKVHEAFRG